MGSVGAHMVQSWLEGAKDYVAVGVWVGNLFAVLASILTALCFLPHWAAVLWLTLLVSANACRVQHSSASAESLGCSCCAAGAALTSGGVLGEVL